MSGVGGPLPTRVGTRKPSIVGHAFFVAWGMTEATGGIASGRAEDKTGAWVATVVGDGAMGPAASRGAGCTAFPPERLHDPTSPVLRLDLPPEDSPALVELRSESRSEKRGDVIIGLSTSPPTAPALAPPDGWWAGIRPCGVNREEGAGCAALTADAPEAAGME